MNAFKHILVPTDFSEASEHALSTAIDVASAFQARLTLLHVWSVPTGYAEALAWPIDNLEKAARVALEAAQRRAAKLFPGTASMLKVGAEWERILETVKEEDIDLIVMGTQGRRGLPRLLLGSVAEKVVRLSPVPVMTVHGPKDAKV